MKFFYTLLIALIIAYAACLLHTACQKQNGRDNRSPMTLPLSASVKPYQGRPTIHINGKPQAPMIYALTDVPGGRWSWDELPQHNIKNFCEQGIRLYQLDIFLDHLWFENDSFRIDVAQKQVRGVLDVCPDAGIFFRFHVNPPKWWIARNPEENTLYDSVEAETELDIGLSRILEADARRPTRHSLASQKWLRESSEKLRRFCREFSQSPEGNALVGVQVASGVYGEWHYWGILKNEADFSEPMQVYFREWLRQKYGSDQNLQIAWGEAGASLTKARVPTTIERAHLSAGLFRHPVKDRKVVDYYQAQHELIADNIIHFCKVVKESWPRPIISGTFYGYFFSVFNRQAFGGHLALHRVLKSEYVDYLSGPQAYYPESGYLPGEPYRSRSLIHSIWLNGKLWLDEYDQQPKKTWPYLSTWDNRENYQKNLRANISIIRRNTLFSLLKGQGMWFYDFGPAAMDLHPNNEFNSQAGTSGYWDHPLYMDNIGQIKTLADSLLEKPFVSRADVLAVYDTESILYMPSTAENKCPITEHLINWSTLAMYYAGVLFDPVHLDDLDKIDFSQYRAVVFFNTFLMEEKDRAIIQNKVAREGRHLIWIYAPAYLNGKTINPDFVSEITDFELDTTRSNQIPEIGIAPSWSDIPSQKAKGLYDPVFFIKDKKAAIYGRYLHLKKPAFGRKNLQNHTAWYIGVPPTNYILFRNIFAEAGARIYSAEKDVVYGGGNLLMLHSKLPGQKTIPLNGDKTASFEVVDTPATIVLDLNSGKIILR